jgi:hypothetical protein
MSKWIEFVRQWAKDNGMTYTQALKDPRVKTEYRKPKMEGGATKEQRLNASMLRSRVTPVGGAKSSLKTALNQITHSADTLDQIQFFEAKGEPYNPYVDWMERPTFVEEGKNAPEGNPVEVIEKGFRNYFQRLMAMPIEDLRNNIDMFPKDGFFVPNNLIHLWDAVVKRMEKTPEETQEQAMDREAFWTDPTNPKVINWIKLKNKANDAWVKSRQSNNKLPEIDMLNQAYINDFADAVKAYNAKYGVRNGMNPVAERERRANIARFPAEYGARKVGGKGVGSSRARVAPEPLAPYEQDGLERMRQANLERRIAEMEARQRAEAERVDRVLNERKEQTKMTVEDAKAKKLRALEKARAKRAEAKAEKKRREREIKMAEKDVRYDVSSGESESDDTIGMGVKTIDFEDMKWGSFTEQLDAYNSGKKDKLSLEEFAKMILKEPSKYKSKTLKRARFYLNVILKKKTTKK